MTFKHKLSVRLALLKDILPLVPVVALLGACELATPVAPPIVTNINVSTVVIVPNAVTLDPGQNQQFVSYGRTPTGDSVAINVTWQAVAGGLISAGGLYTAGTLQGDYAVRATLVPPAAIGAPVTAVPMQTSVVHVDPLAQIVVVPASTSVVTGGTQQFAAYGRRSAGDSVDLSVTWSATGGTISSSGLYTAGPTPGGYVVNASADGLSGTAVVTAVQHPRRHGHRNPGLGESGARLDAAAHRRRQGCERERAHRPDGDVGDERHHDRDGIADWSGDRRHGWYGDDYGDEWRKERKEERQSGEPVGRLGHCDPQPGNRVSRRDAAARGNPQGRQWQSSLRAYCGVDLEHWRGGCRR